MRVISKYNLEFSSCFYAHVRSAGQPRVRSAKKRRIDDSDDEAVEYVISPPSSNLPSISSCVVPVPNTSFRLPLPTEAKVSLPGKAPEGCVMVEIGDIPCAHLFDFVEIAMSSRRETPICLSMRGRRKSSPSAMRLPQISLTAPPVAILRFLLTVRLGRASSPQIHRTRLFSFHPNVHET